ncbi:MAG: hypothetical protein ACK4KT_07745 [Thermaurantimonas sp.]
MITVILLAPSCEVTETVISSSRNLTTIQITDSVGEIIPTVATYRPDGYTEIEGMIRRPFRYRNDEKVRKVSRVRGNNRMKLGAMLAGAAGITAGFTLIGPDGQPGNPLPYYILAGSSLVFGAGLAGMYIDTSVYQRLSYDFYEDADTVRAANAVARLQLNDYNPVNVHFDSTGVLRVNVFTLFNDLRKFTSDPSDTLVIYYGKKRYPIPVKYFSMEAIVSESELPLYAQPQAGETPLVYLSPGTFLIERDVINDQFAEVAVAGISYYTDRGLYSKVYTAPHHYADNLPDINYFVSGFLKNSALRYLTRLDTESADQYQSRLQKFDSQKNSWLRQALEMYALLIRDRMIYTDINLLEYDSDNQLYLVELKGFGRFPVRVSRALVTTFKDSAHNLSFYNIKLAYRRESLEIEEITLFNSSLQTYFTYEDRMRRFFRNSRLREKSRLPDLTLRSEVVNDFFSKSFSDFKRLEDEYTIPIAKLPYLDAAAVFIEISQYKYLTTSNTIMSSLPYLKLLAGQGFGIGPESILTETNATKADFYRIFGRADVGRGQLRKSSSSDSSLFFLYINGTFYYDPDSLRLYILPIDGHPSFIAITSLELSELIKSVRRNGYKTIVALLDGPIIQSKTADSIYLSGLDEHVSLLFSSAPGQKSYTNPRTLLSIFTHCFLKELSNTEGDVTIGRLYDQMCSARRSVPVLAREYHQSEQIPVLIGNRDILFIKSINEPKD